MVCIRRRLSRKPPASMPRRSVASDSVSPPARAARVCSDDEKKWYWVDGRSVVVKDTVGAGDSFLAALIHGPVGPTSRTLRCDIDGVPVGWGNLSPRAMARLRNYTVAPDGTVYSE